ncbi:MAG TPA: hypothetical protein VGA99_03045 [bacterium]
MFEYHNKLLETKKTNLDDFVHNNPVRKGFVEKPECWLYSSARNYVLGDESVITVELLPLV